MGATKRQSTRWVEDNPERGRAIKRAAGARNREKNRAAARAYYCRNRAHILARKYAARATNKRAQHLAGVAVRWAVKKGRLVRPESCSECGGGGRIEGHHDDYARRLDVVWLCTECHNKKHWKD
jgi:hypothetical protein